MAAGQEISGAIVASGVAQLVLGQNQYRKGLAVQNRSSTTMIMRGNGENPTATDGLEIPPRHMLIVPTVLVSQNAIYLYSDVAGSLFQVVEGIDDAWNAAPGGLFPLDVSGGATPFDPTQNLHLTGAVTIDNLTASTPPTTDNSAKPATTSFVRSVLNYFTPVPSIAALRAVSFATLALLNSSATIDVVSYYPGGAGGGGKFVWNPTSTAADDGGSVINPIGNSGAGRFLRVIPASVVTPEMFGAKGDGSTLDHLAIQAALNLGIGVAFGPKTYNLGATVQTTVNGQIISGSIGVTVLNQTVNTVHCFIVANYYTKISGINFTAPTSNGTTSVCLLIQGGYCSFEDFICTGGNVGMEFQNGVSFAKNFQLMSYLEYGVYAHTITTPVGDIYIEAFVMNSSSANATGIRLEQHVEAFVACNGDVLGGARPLSTDAQSYSLGNRPAYCIFTDVYFDSALYGVSLRNCVVFQFTACWFSTGRGASGGDSGVTVGPSDGVSFDGCVFFNNGVHGALVQSSALRTTFKSCKAYNNSTAAGSGAAHGFTIASGTTDFSIIGCVASNTLNVNGGTTVSAQGYGIIVNAGASDRYTIQGNLVSGNQIGGVSDAGTGTNKLVQGNF